MPHAIGNTTPWPLHLRPPIGLIDLAVAPLNCPAVAALEGWVEVELDLVLEGVKSMEYNVERLGVIWACFSEKKNACKKGYSARGSRFLQRRLVFRNGRLFVFFPVLYRPFYT